MSGVSNHPVRRAPRTPSCWCSSTAPWSPIRTVAAPLRSLPRAAGDPRVIPIGFWTEGQRVVMATLPKSAKVAALRKNPKVALTIDQGAFPPKVLLIRGTAEVRLVEGIPDGYLTAGRKVMADDQYTEWVAGVQGLCDEMVVITITPKADDPTPGGPPSAERPGFLLQAGRGGVDQPYDPAVAGQRSTAQIPAPAHLAAASALIRRRRWHQHPLPAISTRPSRHHLTAVATTRTRDPYV